MEKSTFYILLNKKYSDISFTEASWLNSPNETPILESIKQLSEKMPKILNDSIQDKDPSVSLPLERNTQKKSG